MTLAQRVRTLNGLAPRLRPGGGRGGPRALPAAWTAFRNSEMAIILLSGVLGLFVGLGVVVLRVTVTAIHSVLFGIPWGGHLSDGFSLDWWQVAFIPCAGGAVVGGVAWAIKRRRPRETVDPIEANALFGGRMSLTDSLNLALLTVLSGGCGASVGLEAAYTQWGAGFCSNIGHRLSLRRDDMRTLVGCGAAAAIAAAFDAPLAGAFYAFELIIGNYAVANLAPVLLAALAGTFTARDLIGEDLAFATSRAGHLGTPDYFLFVPVGLGAAGLGMIVMQGVTATEQWMRRQAIPPWVRPPIGGLVVGIVALIYPRVLGSGHGGIVANLHFTFALPYLCGLIAAKIAASAISIGVGFRGGLFSSSLFLGTLFGGAVVMALETVAPSLHPDPLVYTLVGMGAVGASIVGAPITMILLVLESTRDFAATVGVTVGVIAATVAVRRWFGYSFATWRFHLRGLKIKGAEDIGWIDSLTISRVMRRDGKSVPVEMSVAAMRKAFPLGAVPQLFAIEDGRLVGIIEPTDLWTPDLGGIPEEVTAADLMTPVAATLLATDNLQSSLRKFSETKAEILPVVDDPDRMELIGYLTEAEALKSYSQELERHRSDMIGEARLVSTALTPEG
ncbi:chloride channel protein [Aliidongia dinghuensis]|uniref:Chloride channel protein n=1 Tax=Aliidongia dinghuensis TaxID=1867774 RepID=A0A8J2YX48_9PROT|nr:chloride channel protein [Aliidongia dinghuensis]GGF30886.1 chloride channel protein [Aliidongia dinghuensis]